MLPIVVVVPLSIYVGMSDLGLLLAAVWLIVTAPYHLLVWLRRRYPATREMEQRRGEFRADLRARWLTSR